MKKSVLMTPGYDKNGYIIRSIFSTDPYDTAEGLLRITQKFAAILLTSKGTDSIRPWFGTRFNEIATGNIGDIAVLKMNIKAQVDDAYQQYVRLQDDDVGLTKDDLLASVVVKDIIVNEDASVGVVLRFTSYTQRAIELSLRG